MNVRVESPDDLAGALAALVGATERTRVLAGGTDLMVELESDGARCDRVVDVWRVDELRGVSRSDEGLRIGALTTCAELIRSPLVRAEVEILAEAADQCGAEQIKNRATIGGNLGTASPAADLCPVLLALGAEVQLVSQRGGPRVVAIGEYFTGYRATARRPDELIESVVVAPRDPLERRAFRKVGTRRAQSISKVVLAAAAVLDEGTVRSITVAAGSVADRTLLLPSVGRELRGRRPDAALVERAARRAAREDIAPIDDVRSSAAYRRAATQRVLRRMLEQLVPG